MPVNWLTDKIKNSRVVYDTLLYVHKETRQALIFKWTPSPPKQQQQQTNNKNNTKSFDLFIWVFCCCNVQSSIQEDKSLNNN